MNDYLFRFQGLDTIFPSDRALTDLDILTTAQAIRRVAYSAAQLPLLAKLHDFPLPVELSPLAVGWKAQELEEWKQLRDKKLLSTLL